MQQHGNQKSSSVSYSCCSAYKLKTSSLQVDNPSENLGDFLDKVFLLKNDFIGKI